MPISVSKAKFANTSRSFNEFRSAAKQVDESETVPEKAMALFHHIVGTVARMNTRKLKGVISAGYFLGATLAAAVFTDRIPPRSEYCDRITEVGPASIVEWQQGPFLACTRLSAPSTLGGLAGSGLGAATLLVAGCVSSKKREDTLAI